MNNSDFSNLRKFIFVNGESGELTKGGIVILCFACFSYIFGLLNNER